jgi:homoserine kinase type II
MPVSSELLRDILNCWGLAFEDLHPEIPIQGSPERCLYRVVVDAGGSRHLLEELDSRTMARKIRIARHVTLLAARGLPALAPRAGLDGSFVQRVADRTWQLTPFLDGLAPNPENLWRDAWRGEALALFLRDLRQAAHDLDATEIPFDLRAYAAQIASDAQKRHPSVFARLSPVFALIDGQLAACPSLPTAFSHGDPHPLNMIWGKDRILGAIDWEFCGPKCVLHDMALIIGCVGSDDEAALGGPLVTTFVDTLRSCGLLDSTLAAHLPTWILALRTAWLAEWLRREDTDMIEFEMFYMTTLAQRFFGGNAAL